MKKEYISKKNKSRMRRLSSLFQKFVSLILYIPSVYGKKMQQDDYACNLMIPISQAMEERSNCYVTYNLYPKEAINQNDWCYGRGVYASKVAILMQGPIRKNENFTLETVKFYGKIFPNVKIIISTWMTEDKEQIRLLQNESNCVVVLNDEPQYAGVANINFQMRSSLGGVRKARELGIEYVLKTRTDSRISMPGVLENLVELVEHYSVESSQKTVKRIVVFNAYLFLPYQEFGTYYFGRVGEMERLFDCKLHMGSSGINYADSLLDRRVTYREMFTDGSALNWAMKNYFICQHGDVECDLEQWWKDVGEYLICLPVAWLRPLWVKYDYNHEESDMTWMYRRKILGSVGVDNTMIDFAMWNELRCGKYPDKKMYENLVDIPMR